MTISTLLPQLFGLAQCGAHGIVRGQILALNWKLRDDQKNVNERCKEPENCSNIWEFKGTKCKKNGKISKIVDLRDATNRLRLKLLQFKVNCRIKKKTYHQMWRVDSFDQMAIQPVILGFNQQESDGNGAPQRREVQTVGFHQKWDALDFTIATVHLSLQPWHWAPLQ